MLIITPLDKVADLVREEPIARILGLLGPSMPHPLLPNYPDAQRLQLVFNDVAAPVEGMVTVGQADIENLLRFVEGWQPGEGPMLIHCLAGVSRSTASAFITMCLFNPQEDEIDLARELRDLSPTASPNKMMIAQADQIMNRKGRMNAAIADIGPGRHAFEGQEFRWNVIR